MTDIPLDEARDARLRRLKFRSWHRGIREMDSILGRFADASIASLSAAELEAYEELLEVPDHDLFAWVTGASEAPADQARGVFLRLCAFHRASEKA